MTVVIDQPISALSVRIFSMLTSAAPGSTCTLSSGKRLLMTCDAAAAIGVQLPPVGPALKMTSVFCWAWAGPAAASDSAATSERRRDAQLTEDMDGHLDLPSMAQCLFWGDTVRALCSDYHTATYVGSGNPLLAEHGSGSSAQLSSARSLLRNDPLDIPGTFPPGYTVRCSTLACRRSRCHGRSPSASSRD